VLEDLGVKHIFGTQGLLRAVGAIREAASGVAIRAGGPFSVTFVDEFSNGREAAFQRAAKHGV